MKKKRICVAESFCAPIKIWRIMRLSLFFVLVCIAQVWATNSYSQQTRLTMNLSNVKVIDVLNEIEEKTEYFFLFNQKLVNVDRVVNVKVNQQKVEEVLSLLFDDYSIDYRIMDRQIVLSPENLLSKQAQRTITGNVTNESGQPIPGATVVVKGTSHGVITDPDGNFQLTNVKTGQTLVISFVGMTTQEVPITAQSSFNIILQESTIGLEEVVAVGYGVQKKTNVTGAITTVSSDQLEDVSSASVSSALQGKLSGVSITKSSGKPGAGSEIRIRGMGTFGNNNPLIVIDGIPVENGMESLDPGDIESVNVLKDAASSAIYGSRAANGVILISTQRGVEGKGEVNVNAYYGVQSILDKPEVCNAAEFVELQNEARANANRWVGTDYEPFFENSPASYGEGTDWLDEMFTVAPISNIALNARGGNEASKYYVAGSFLNQDGIRVNTGFKKANFRVNLDSKVNERLTIGTSINLSYGHSYGSASAGEGVVYVSPTIPVTESDGTPGYGKHGGENYFSPLFPAELNTPKSDNYRALANAYAEYNIFDFLSFRFQGGIDLNYYENKSFSHTYNIGNKWGTSRNNYTESRGKGLTWLTDYLLNFNKSFDDTHNFDGVLGFSMQQNTNDDIYGKAYDYVSEADLMHVLNAGTNPVDSRTSGGKSQLSLMSYFGRVNYNFREKYMFSVNFRADGSSRFLGDNKWGFFPSVSGAWRVNQEEFFAVESISNLKLRVNWGQLGNQSVGSRYPAIETLSSTNILLGAGGSNHVIHPGFFQSQLVNKDLRWETTTIANIGVDLGFLNGKLNTSLEYFNKVTDDILRTQVLPGTVGMSAPVINYASVKNTGFELEANWNDKIGEFQYSIGVNFSTIKNQVTRLSDGNDEEIVYGGARMININRVGEPMMSFWGWEQEGIYASQEDIDNSPTYGSAIIGSLKYKDLNNDGTIDAEDRTIIGDAIPDFTGGVRIEAKYKGFDFMVFGQGEYGKMQWNPYPKWINDAWRNYPKFYYEKRWNGEGEPGMFPAVIWGQASGMNQSSDFLLSDVSYFRLKNVSLGYTFDVEKLGKVRFYFSGENLFTLTKKDFFGYDPENGGLAQFFYWGDAYPTAKTYMLGVNLKF